MTVRKRDTSLARRHFIAFAVGAAAAIAIVGLVAQQLRFHRYRCPGCRARLERAIGSPRARLEFHCQNATSSGRLGSVWRRGMGDDAT